MSMLVPLRARRTVLVIPVWIFVGALVCAALATNAALRSGEWQLIASSAVFAVGLGWLGVSELAVATVEQGVLRVSRAGKQLRLRAPDVAFGVYLRGSRAVEYVVFASDGAQRCDLSTHVSLRRARRSAERIGETLLEPGHVAGAAAMRAVQAQEQSWQAAAAQAQNVVDEYYRSSSWKWTKRAVIAVVSAYVLGMALYQWLSGAQ